MIKKLLCLFFICMGLKLSAQKEDDKTKIFPAPDVASMVKGYQISNNYFNGSVNINLPLYEYNNKNITIPISVSYNGGGIKPDQQPGVLGIGWKLNVGGIITRNVKNQPDEYKPLRTLRDNSIGMPFYNTDPVPGNYAYIDNYNKLNKNDWSSQSYLNTFNTNSPYSTFTQYTFTTNANPLLDLEPDEFIFEFNGISGKFSLDYTGKWQVITDAPGINFTIEPVIGKEIKKASAKNIPRAYTQFKLTANDGTVYIFGDSSNISPVNIDYSHTSKWEKDPPNSYGGPDVPVMPNAWHLSKIITTTGREVNFTYKKLGFPVQKILSYWGSYPPGSPIAEIPSPRSLDKVLTETWYMESITVNDSTKIKFDITPSDQLGTDEIIESGSNYFNGVNSSVSFPYEEKITFPKLNDITIYSNTFLVRKISFSFIENINERLKLEYVKIQDIPGISSLDYKFDYNAQKLPPYGTAKIDHWGYYNNVDYFATALKPHTFDKLNTEYVSSRSPNFTYGKAEILEKMTLPTGGEILFTYEPNKYSKLADLWPFTINDLGLDKEAGGARISKIITRENGNIVDEKEYIYTKPNSTISSGVLAVPIPKYTTGTALEFSFRAEAYDPFNQRGNSVVYTRVIEKFKNNGYKVYDYKNFDNGSNDKSAVTELPLNMHYLFNKDSYNNISYQRGKLIKESVYNNSNQLLRETEYQYTHDNVTPFKLRGIHYLPSIRWNDNIYRAAAYETDFFNDLLLATKTKEYLSNGTLNQSVNNKYDEFNNVIESQSLDDKGDTIKTIFKYAYSYPVQAVDAASLGIKNLVQNNCKNYLIEEIIIKKTVGTLQTTVTGGTLYIYKSQSPFIDKVYKLQTATPIPFASFTASNIVNGNFVKDTRYLQPEMTIEQYDSRGNILQSLSKNDSVTSKIWDYNNTYMSAEIKNASYINVAATSFEADGKGNFNFSGTPTAVPSALTGKKVYILSNGSISKTGLNASKTYIVTYWSKNGQQVVNATSATIGISKNGWTLYKHKVVNPANGTITISGTGTIDELRLYPEEGKVVPQMVTYTYDPLIGVTSQCDADNNIIYYKYDGFNRLSNIYDIDKKIIKRVCYNYAGQPEDCTTGITYYNQQLSQGIAKNNCQPGYTGSVVMYTVPANIYSSEISQADANVQAQTEIDANGQAYANVNGNCSVTCTPQNCSGASKKCINNICETGKTVVTDSWFDGKKWQCTLHYEWSDGSESQDYQSSSAAICDY